MEYTFFEVILNKGDIMSVISKSIWERKRTWFAPIFLAAILIFIQLFYQSFGTSISDGYYQLVMIMFIAIVIAFLGERIEKVRILNEMNEI